ncbi:MAG TPA: hypothetical protein VF743_00380, partial [Acidimicrobiales bacterium]
MSLVVDRPGAGAPEPDEVPDGADEPAGASEASAARADRTDGDGAPETRAAALVRVLVAMATLGAAVVHFAFAPEHLGENGAHGAFFLAVGWLQLACAAALAFRARPLRLWLGVTALVDAGVVAVWVLSRTAGVPGSDREPVAFPDTLTTVLEVVAVAGAVVLLTGWLARPAAS